MSDELDPHYPLLTALAAPADVKDMDNDGLRALFALGQDFVPQLEGIDDFQQSGRAFPAAWHFPIAKNGLAVRGHFKWPRTDIPFAQLCRHVPVRRMVRRI